MLPTAAAMLSNGPVSGLSATQPASADVRSTCFPDSILTQIVLAGSEVPATSSSMRVVPER